jgi:DNA invertase Pin-like site-specific DNA recombinase
MSPAKKPTKPVAIYTRTSEQGRRSDEELQTHEIQRGKVEAYLKAKGMTASPEVFEDTDVSGGKLSRPAFDRAVAGVLNGTYGGLAVAYLDRFARRRDADQLITKIEEAGGTFIALDFDFDTSTAMGRAMLAVVLAFATLTREQGVEKAADLAKKKLAEGTALGGPPPQGYFYEVTGTDSNGKHILGGLVPNDDADAVRKILEDFADGAMTVGGVADALNAAGIPTRFGNPWRLKSASRWLRRAEVYIGTRVYGDQRIPDSHEALIDSGTWRRIQKRLAPVEVEGTKTRTRGDGYALGEGLVRCGKCGKPLSRGTASRIPSLRCNERGSGHPSINLQTATDYVADVALRNWGAFNYQRTEGGNVEEREAAEAALRRAQANLREAEELVGQKLSSDSKQGRAVTEAQAARDALDPEDAIVRMFVFDPEREDTAERFAAFDPPTQRRLLRALGIEKVVLLAGVKGPVASRLQVEFTDGSVWNEGEHAAEREAELDARARAEWAEFEREHPRKADKAKRKAEAFLAVAQEVEVA